MLIDCDTCAMRDIACSDCVITGRRSPAWALRPTQRQPVQAAERVVHATPVGLRLGRSALHVCHHHQSVREQPSVRRRDRHWHAQTFTIEVLQPIETYPP